METVDSVEPGGVDGIEFGPFVLTGVIGRGATSTVYLARDEFGVPVAVKVLDPALAGLSGFGELLERESTVLAGMDSPHVVGTRGTGVVDGVRYLAMTYVEGASLRNVERSAGRLSAPQALGLLTGALEGLTTIHAAGLVHGDVKPENILCDRAGVARLCDVGQVLPLGGTTQGGTPAYMSPEAARGLPLDTRSDVYSMGVVLFEAMAGHRPFDGTNDLAVLRQHAEVEPPPLEQAGPATRALVARVLAKDPAQRPPTAAAFLRNLEAAAASDEGSDWRARAAVAGIVAVAATAVEELALPTTAGAAGLTSPASAATPAAKGGGLLTAHPVLVGAAAVVVAAGLVVGGIALGRGASSTNTQPAAARVAAVPAVSFAEVEKAMCARLGADSEGDHCAMYTMKVSKIDTRWVLAQGVGFYAGNAVHPQVTDAKSDLAEGVYDAMTHKVVALDHLSDCASTVALFAPVPHPVVVGWGFGSCLGQSGSVPSASNTTTTTTLVPSPTTTIAAVSSLDLSALAGSWYAHEQTLTISGGGQGSLSYADLTQCPSCSFGNAPVGTMEFVLSSGGGSSASGTITSSSDSTNYQVGQPITVAIGAGSPGQILNLSVGTSGPAMYCNSSSQGQCGA